MTGIIGLGAMGSNMALILLQNMQEIMVYDVIEEKGKSMVEQGALAASGIPEIVSNCETIILSLPSSEITTELMEFQLLPIIKEGQVIVDTGTTIVADISRLSQMFSDKEAFLIDAPVSGGSVGASAGRLYMFAGGDKDALQRIMNILSILAGSRITYCGKSGNGQIVKAVNQLAMGIVDAAYLECIAFGVAAGVDISIIRNAVGGNNGFRKHLADTADKIIDGQGDRICCKIPEYKYFMNEADSKGMEAPILRSLNSLVQDKSATEHDNMNRPYTPLWSILN